MKNHFVFAYAGNKRQEVERLYTNLNLDKIKYIVEPFCGTSAFSYYISTKHPGEFYYVLNDNNTYLVKLYNLLRSVKKTKAFEKEVNDKCKDIDCKEKYDALKQEDSFINWFILNKNYRIRPGFYNQDRGMKVVNFDDYPVVKFLREEKVVILNEDGNDIVERFRDKKCCLMFLDPPYIISTNSFYRNPNLNIFEYLSINKIQKFGCRVILCLNDNWIIRLMFEGCIKEEYDKQYETSRGRNDNKVKHLIITNY